MVLTMRPDSKLYQVFMSSTFEDLKNERELMAKSLLNSDFIPAGMEFFGAIDLNQKACIEKVIGESDYYLVVSAGRYGSIAYSDVSYTELEYRYAVDLGIPVCALIHSDLDNIPRGATERDPARAKKLIEFQAQLSSGRIVAYWSSPQELVAKAIIALNKARHLFPREGWVRANQMQKSEVGELGTKEGLSYTDRTGPPAIREGRGLRVVLAPEKLTRGADAIYAEIKSTLAPATETGARGGSITLLLPVPQRAKQIEFKIPGRFDVSPNAAGTLEALIGVARVEEV